MEVAGVEKVWLVGTLAAALGVAVVIVNEIPGLARVEFGFE